MMAVIILAFLHMQNVRLELSSHSSDRLALKQEADRLAAKVVHPMYMADFSDDKILMGGSQNVFVGKVIDQIGTSERWAGPETQFSVEVISNIKGDLRGMITVDQVGGYKNGDLYIIKGDVLGDDMVIPMSDDEKHYMLQPGTTYLFATRYSPTNNWYMLNSFPTARKTISENSSLGVSALWTLAASDPRVQELQAAYPKEVLLAADIGHSNTRNSYASLSEQQKAALPYYVAPPPPPPPAPAPTSTPPVVAAPPAPAPTSTDSVASSTPPVAPLAASAASSTGM
ncbi:MAG: hypothetical protein Q7S28_03560 [bacterium]|nr:hypothetical protein [bacterium]